MTSPDATTSAVPGPLPAAALTRPQRQALLRSLLLGRGLERVLRRSSARHTPPEGAEADAVLAAIAAAAGLEAGDHLVVPHGFLAAQIAADRVGPAEIAAARLGRPSPCPSAGRGPQSPVGIAAGVAFALSRAGRHDAAVALIDRRWAEAPECHGGLGMARELALPLVVVAIDTTDAAGGAPAVDRCDFEAVRAAVRAAIDQAHADAGPSLVVCARGHATADSFDEAARFRAPTGDPLAEYERRLMVHGFSRADLDAIRRAAARELDSALEELIAMPERSG